MGNGGGRRVLKSRLEPLVSKFPKELYGTNRVQSIYLSFANAGQVENRILQPNITELHSMHIPTGAPRVQQSDT